MPNQPLVFAAAALATYALIGVAWLLASGGPARAEAAWSHDPPSAGRLALLLLALVMIWPRDVQLFVRSRFR